jgi:hypothetical protein
MCFICISEQTAITVFPYAETTGWFLGVFAKLQKATVASLCLPVHLSAWNNLAPTGRIFINFIFKYFLKNCQENSSFIKIGQEYRYCTRRPNYVFDHILSNYS